MIHINLFPWRAVKYEKTKRENIAFLIVAGIIAIFILMGWSFYVSQQQNLQQKKIALLTEKTQELSKNIKKYRAAEESYQQLLSSIDALSLLQANRFQIVRLFNELPRLTPEKINLTSLEYDRGKIIIAGMAHSNEDIVELMNNISKIDWLKKINLEKINREKKGKEVVVFSLEMQMSQ